MRKKKKTEEELLEEYFDSKEYIVVVDQKYKNIQYDISLAMFSGKPIVPSILTKYYVYMMSGSEIGEFISECGVNHLIHVSKNIPMYVTEYSEISEEE